jgi:hypothetical protein
MAPARTQRAQRQRVGRHGSRTFATYAASALTGLLLGGLALWVLATLDVNLFGYHAALLAFPTVLLGTAGYFSSKRVPSEVFGGGLRVTALLVLAKPVTAGLPSLERAVAASGIESYDAILRALTHLFLGELVAGVVATMAVVVGRSLSRRGRRLARRHRRDRLTVEEGI